jgi:hypothetical protein
MTPPPMTTATLTADRRDHVSRYGLRALDEAGALGVIPTPLDQVASALGLPPAANLFDTDDVPPELAARLKRLYGKVRGALSTRDRSIFLSREQKLPEARFAHGHEIGHGALPWHSDAYSGGDGRTLDPDIRAELEAEASAFSADLLFNMGTFTAQAHSGNLSLASPLELAPVYQASLHASIRRYVEDSPRPCALLILGREPVLHDGKSALTVQQGMESASFRDRHGPVAQCFPGELQVDQWRFARDAYNAVGGGAGGPITHGETIAHTGCGKTHLRYEVFSNNYRYFVLMVPSA